MGYFQTTNPWMSFAEAGRGVGSALGEYLKELPRLRAEVAIQAQREPQRLAMQAAQIEGQGIENALGREKVANRGLYRQLLEGQVNDLGLQHQRLMSQVEADRQAQEQHRLSLEEFKRQQAADLLFRQKAPFMGNSVEQGGPAYGEQGVESPDMQAIRLGAQLGASPGAISPYSYLMQHSQDAALNQARLGELTSQSRYQNAHADALLNPRQQISPDHLAQNYGNAIKLFSTVAPEGVIPGVKHGNRPLYNQATNDITTLGAIIRNQALGQQRNGVPQQVPLRNARGWLLHEDASGNKAYVGPNGEVEPVR